MDSFFGLELSEELKKAFQYLSIIGQGFIIAVTTGFLFVIFQKLRYVAE